MQELPSLDVDPVVAGQGTIGPPRRTRSRLRLAPFLQFSVGFLHLMHVSTV